MKRSRCVAKRLSLSSHQTRLIIACTMTSRTTYRRFALALILPAYLLVSIACACVTAATEPVSAHSRTSHSCCLEKHKASSKDKKGHHSQKDTRHSCVHCRKAQLSEPDAVAVPIGAFSHWVMLPIVQTRIDAPTFLTLAAYSESAVLSASPPSILRQKCTLLI